MEYGFLFFSFFLVGFFQLLDLFDSCKKETGIIFKSFFKNEKKESNETFIELYINSCFKNIPEFDFTFITSILGSFPLKFFGYYISSLIFTLLNGFAFINFLKIDFEKTEYNFFDFFHVSMYFLLFFISFGSVSLFPHEKISEGIMFYEKIKDKYKKVLECLEYNSEKEKEKQSNEIDINDNKENVQNENKIKIKLEKQRENKEIEIENKSEKNQEENKTEEDQEIYNQILARETRKKYNVEENIFLIISFGIIFAYVLNKLVNYLIYKKLSEFHNKHFMEIFLLIYIGSYSLSLFFYLQFYIRIKIIEEIDDVGEDEEKIESNYYRFCGFLMYYEKLNINNDEEEKKDKEKKQEKDDKIIEESIKKGIETEEKKQKNIISNVGDISINIYNIKNQNYKKENKNKNFKHENNNNIFPKTEDKLNDDIINEKNNENNNNDNNSRKKSYNNKKGININYFEILLSIIIPCYKDCKKDNKNSKYCCASCKLGWRKCFFKSKKNEFKKFVNCLPCCKCEE